jgi:Flp pilus assembly protein TadG
MKSPAIKRSRRNRRSSRSRRPERGITMVLVAIAMVAIIAMAALSIDVITLYLAREEAQRSADQAALAAARVISISGMTGDPNNSALSWQAICGPGGFATQAATAVATESAVGGTADSPTVTYSAGGMTKDDCSALTAGGPFSVNPIVTVQLTRASLPTFFSRIWGNTGNTVSASATAEVLNPSASDLNTNGGPTGTVTPVLPSCVKPWVVPNQDPLNPGNSFVSTTDGSIKNPGISLNGGNATGVIGETFWLVLDCQHNNPSYCQLRQVRGVPVQPSANYSSGVPSNEGPPNLLYVPGQVGTPVTAIPSCTQGDPYEEAIEGCDSATNYQCGVQPPAGTNVVDMSRNPDRSGATTNGVQCLIQQADATNKTSSSGQDTLSPFAAPSAYPFQILAGSNSALGKKVGLNGTSVSSSNSIVSLPIFDNSVSINDTGTTTPVTFIGFLQVFINAVDQYGNVNVTVLNVAGCGNGGTVPVGSGAVTGTSPVPIRLVTPP